MKYVIIDQNLCKHCGNCAMKCKNKAITFIASLNAFWHQPEKCKQCNKCQLACPFSALKVG